MRLEEGHQKGNKDERTRVESAGQRQGKNTRDNGYLKLEKSMFITLGCRLPRWRLRCMITLASLWQWRNHWFVLFSQGVKMGWEIQKGSLARWTLHPECRCVAQWHLVYTSPSDSL